MKHLLTLFLLIVLQGCQSYTASIDTPEQNLAKPVQIPPIHHKLAPIHSKQTTPPALIQPTNLWARFQKQLQLPDISANETQAAVQWYLKNKRLLVENQSRIGYFLFFIVDELEKEGVPVDIALIPIIESQYNPLAKGRQTAGLWQFMPATAHRFNLYSNSWYDGRLDPIESTKAVSTYFRYLLNYFNNDLLLAISAYNAGEGTVQNAINKNRRLGKPTDFWHLTLPAGTRNYVNKMIALAHIYRHPEQYNLTLQAINDQRYFVSILIDNGLTLDQVAQALQITPVEIHLLNAGIKFNQRPTRPKYSINIPVKNSENASLILSQLPRYSWVSKQKHQVKNGETLAAIARRYGLDIEQIRDWNSLKSDRLRIGQILIIAKPVSRANATTKGQINKPKLRTTLHIVKSGDNLWDIAKKYQIKMSDLMQWNHKKADSRLKIGEKLIILHPTKS